MNATNPYTQSYSSTGLTQGEEIPSSSAENEGSAHNTTGSAENCPAPPLLQPQQAADRRQFSCLYTRHKTQKRKVWQDGRLVVRGCRAVLHAAYPVPGAGDPVLDQCEVTKVQSDGLQAGRLCDLETEKHLVTVEGPWTSVTGSFTLTSSSSSISNNTSQQQSKVSASMQKVLTRKFQRPKHQIPPPNRPQMGSFLHKRRRPLQPGELHKKYHGGQSMMAPPPHVEPPPPCFQPQGMMMKATTTTTSRVEQRMPHQPALPLRQNPPSHPQPLLSSFQQIQNNTRPMEQQQQPRARNSSIISNDETASVVVPTGSESDALSNDPIQNNDPPQITSLQHDTIRNNDVHTNNNNSTAPQPRPETTKQQKSMWNAGNGFDPSSFYGEDEEEEDNDDDNDDDDAPTELFQFGGASSLPPNKTTSASPERFPVAQHQTSNKTAETLSTNQLLDLFGGRGGGVATTTTNQPSSVAATEPPTTSSPVHPVTSTESATGTEEGDDFVLPPSADSSSEDESSQ